MDSEIIRKAISDIYRGNLVTCSKEEYPDVRWAIQEQAGKWIDGGDALRAQIALAEVKRLDAIHKDTQP